VKPDREIFGLWSSSSGPSDRVLFLDDNAINVEGALASGFRAEQARASPKPEPSWPLRLLG